MEKDANESTKALSIKPIGLAKPGDRIAAFVLDCSLLLPIGQLLQAPVKRWILESYLFRQGSEVPFLEFISSSLLLSLIVFYFTMMTYFYGQTLGQKFLKIKTISYQGSISFQSAFFRSFGTLIEIILCGLPLLAILRHPLRRSPHDRLTDTLVISLDKPAGYPTDREIRWAKVGAVCLSILLIIVLTSALLPPTLDLESENKYSYDSRRCDKFLNKVSGSLSGLIAGYLTDKIHSECLYQKSRDSLWAQENVELAQFAMSVSTSENPELSNRYINEVCDSPIASELCSFTEWLQTPLAERSLEALNVIVDQPNQEPFVKIYGASISILSGHYENAERVLKSIAPTESLSPLMANLGLQALLGQGKWQQAYWVLKTNPVLSQLDVIHFAENQIAHPFMAKQKQLQLLQFFFPTLESKDLGRGLASSSDLPLRVEQLYKTLKESR